jgi:hypothetical protein
MLKRYETMILKILVPCMSVALTTITLVAADAARAEAPVPDTLQTACFDATVEIPAQQLAKPFLVAKLPVIHCHVCRSLRIFLYGSKTNLVAADA